MTEPHDVLEALLFASDAPVEAALIQEVLELPSADAARALVQDLRTRFEDQDRVLQIIEAGGGFRLVTRPEVAPWLVKLARSKTKSRLSRPALETLAIIAYRQPVSRPEVDAARGVNSEGVLDNLLERRLVRIAGRKESAGRPFLYETTREFLVAFGLRDLGDLPKVEGELIVVDPGAAAETAVGDADAADSARADAADAAPPPTRWSTRPPAMPLLRKPTGRRSPSQIRSSSRPRRRRPPPPGPRAQSPRSAPSRRGTSPLPPIRISKILAQRGLSSRRGAEALLGAGRVRINGEVRREPGAQADPEGDVITVDGRPLPPIAAHRYVLLHKPRGYVTSRRDPEGRPVVIDLLPSGAERLFPVGRLDFDAEGLLLLTNDGELGNRLLHPRYEIPRVYEVQVERRVRAEDLPRWRRGAVLPDGPAVPRAVRIIRGGGHGQTRGRRGSRSRSPRGAIARSSGTARPWAIRCCASGASSSGPCGSGAFPSGAAASSRRASGRD